MTTGTHPSGGLALIGFGEAAQAFARGWGAARTAGLRAHDIKTGHADAAVRDAKWADYARCRVAGAATPAEALDGAGIVFSLVTADQALDAAKTAAAHLATGALFLDGNSCAPDSKRRAAATIEAAGGRYVDVAIMAPVHPALHRVPLLIGGPHATAARDALAGLDMTATLVDGGVGVASSIKMIRSIMMKGLEALALECVLAGRRAGVDEAVLASLDASFPGVDAGTRAAHMMERAATHGIRRAAEMREAARMLDDLGLAGRMARATVDWQQEVGQLGLAARDTDYAALADALLARLLDGEPA